MGTECRLVLWGMQVSPEWRELALGEGPKHDPAQLSRGFWERVFSLDWAGGLGARGKLFQFSQAPLIVSSVHRDTNT